MAKLRRRDQRAGVRQGREFLDRGQQLIDERSSVFGIVGELMLRDVFEVRERRLGEFHAPVLHLTEQAFSGFFQRDCLAACHLVFRDADHAWECLGGLFEALSRDAEVGPKLREAGFVVRFNYADPALSVTVDAVAPGPQAGAQDGGYVTVLRGNGGRTPQVELDMTADAAHRFWLGRVNPMMAMMKREIVARGPIGLVMKLLPVVKPAYGIYPRLLVERGYGALVEA